MISMEASQSFELRQLQDNWRTPVFSIRHDSANLPICDVQDAECHPFHCLFRAMEASRVVWFVCFFLTRAVSPLPPQKRRNAVGL